jgi:hypothetical protein
LPRVLEMLRSGAIHLSGLRVLVPHLTQESADALLEQAARKSKRAIEEIAACHAPRPAVPESIRKVPERQAEQAATVAPPLAPAPALLLSVPAQTPRPATMAPLAQDRYHVQLTASRELRDKIEEAKALLRHQVPSGDLAVILDRAPEFVRHRPIAARFAVFRGSGASRSSWRFPATPSCH